MCLTETFPELIISAHLHTVCMYLKTVLEGKEESADVLLHFSKGEEPKKVLYY